MQLHYESYGEGYPLIILHGLFGSLENWRTVSRALAGCYHVYALDLRNHGDSPHSDEFNYRLMAEDVLQLMRSQGLGSAYLLGHSMGGKVAMQLALDHPERVDKLAVADIAPKPYARHHDEILAALRSIDPAVFHRRKDVDAALAQQLPDLALRLFLLKNLAREPNGSFRWKINLDAIARHYPEILEGMPSESRFEKPTLFIRSELSGYVRSDDQPLIRSLFPYAKIVTLSSVGHWLHVEARRRFTRLLFAFFGTV